MDEDYERVLLTKNEVFVYKIPPLTTSRGHKATDWDLDKPLWTGRSQIIAKGKKCFIKLVDKDTGNLFARAPIDTYPGPSIEPVTDSSRYFVIKIVNEQDPKRSAFVGMGFADRGDSFDLNVALQDHFKSLKQEEAIERAGGAEAFAESQPKLDLGLKEGQTIKVNINLPKKGSARPKPKAPGQTGLGILLPPPPGSSSKISTSDKGHESATEHASDHDNVKRPSSPPPGDTLLDLEFDQLSMATKSVDTQLASVEKIRPTAISANNSGDGDNADWAAFK